MKVLIDLAGIPFHLAHGGARTQILGTRAGLEAHGVEVEFARWWDQDQKGDVIHIFGVPKADYLKYAARKGVPVINTTLFTAACNRSDRRLSLQGLGIGLARRMPQVPPFSVLRSGLDRSAFALCTRNVVGLAAEVEVLKRAYQVPEEQIRVVPLALPDAFHGVTPGERSSPFLITTGTITARKRSLELARLAHEQQVPICFVGKPYDETDPYWHAFRERIDDKWVRHVPHTESVDEMIRLLRESRGFVLGSDYENWCLSAHEAAACGLPLLLPDQRWSRERFGDQVRYFPPGAVSGGGAALKEFYGEAPGLAPPGVEHLRWADVGRMMIGIYEEVMR